MGSTIRIITLDNKEFETDCIGCTLAKHEIEPLGGYIAETKYFQVTQDTEIPIPGFMILNSIRHIRGLADFTSEEQTDFIAFATRIRVAMRDVLKISGVLMRVSMPLKISRRVFIPMTISSIDALPARSPIPLMVHST